MEASEESVYFGSDARPLEITGLQHSNISIYTIIELIGKIIVVEHSLEGM